MESLRWCTLGYQVRSPICRNSDTFCTSLNHTIRNLLYTLRSMTGLREYTLLARTYHFRRCYNAQHDK
jgi:hypothetical protein